VHFYWETTIIALFAFVILYVLLNKYAFGPLFSVMEKRQEIVKNQLQTAEENRRQAEELLQQQKQAIQDARKEAYEIIEQARVSSQRQTDDLLEKAKNESVRIKEDALREIESEKNKAVASLKSQVGAMSVMIASKIIEKQIDEKSQEQLVDQYLKEVGGKA